MTDMREAIPRLHCQASASQAGCFLRGRGILMAVVLGGALWGCAKRGPAAAAVASAPQSQAPAAPSAGELVRRGGQAFERGEMAEARSLLDKGLEGLPQGDAQRGQAHLWLARIAQKDQDLPRERSHLEIALQARPQDATLMLRLGGVLKRQQQLEAAAALLGKALEKFPGDRDLLMELMDTYRLQGQFKEAARTGYQLLSRASADLAVYRELARVYLEERKYEITELLCLNAQRIFQERQQKEPSLKEDPELVLIQGLMYAQTDRPREALSQFVRAVALDGDYFEGWMNLGAMAQRFRDHARAVQAYEKALGLRRDDPLAIKGLAFALRGNGDHQRAFDLCGRVLAQDGQDAQCLFWTGEILEVYQKDFPRAVEYYERYKTVLGSALTAADPVHQRLQAARAKLGQQEDLSREKQP